MTISSSDIESIKELFGCREGTARHYLEIFGNDRDRAINSVLSYGNDPDWWGHPWNAGCSDARADNGNDGEDESDYDDGDASSANQVRILSYALDNLFLLIAQIADDMDLTGN